MALQPQLSRLFRLIDCTRLWSGLLLLAAASCGGDKSSTSPTPATPTPTPTPVATTFTLSGTVTDSTTATALSGAAISIADGVNAGKSTTTGSSGTYSLAGLQQSGFTVNV